MKIDSNRKDEVEIISGKRVVVVVEKVYAQQMNRPIRVREKRFVCIDV